MHTTLFHISKMDCPCEEALVRMKLEPLEGIHTLTFDLQARTLRVVHSGEAARIESGLHELNLGAKLLSTAGTDGQDAPEDASMQRKVLWTVLAINAGFFVIEILTGLLSRSMGLVADSLDMLADALVYGMSLMAVGAAVSRKKKVALYSGVIQIALAVMGLSEVIRRFIGVELMPDFRLMIGISLLALVANAICLWLLQRTRSREAHIRASVIFSANDVIINLGVILAGVLVWQLGSNIPDLVIGIAVFLIVIRGAVRILKLAR